MLDLDASTYWQGAPAANEAAKSSPLAPGVARFCHQGNGYVLIADRCSKRMDLKA